MKAGLTDLGVSRSNGAAFYVREIRAGGSGEASGAGGGGRLFRVRSGVPLTRSDYFGVSELSSAQFDRCKTVTELFRGQQL
jgi:hypothetical protein